MYTFLCTNIPINIYIMRRIVFKRDQPWLDVFIAWFVALLQFGGAVAVFLPIAWCNTVYHAPKRFIPRLQFMMAAHYRWLPSKLKYDDLYNRLMHGPKITVAIGPVNAITYWAFIEVCLGKVARI